MSDTLHEWQGAAEANFLLPSSAIESELTSMPISRAIFRLAWPAMTSMVLLMIFNLVDAWWVGKLGAEQFAGVSAAAFIYWALQSVATLVSTGVTAMVARFVGGKDPDQACLVVGQGFVLSIFLAILFGVGGYYFQAPTYRYMGLTAPVATAAFDYMNLIMAGLAPIFIFFAIDAAFRGMGDTKTPLKILSLALIFNAVLDPFLILGWGPFPRMQAGGAALATVLSHILADIIGIYLLQKRRVRIRFADSKRLADLSLVWRISRIGAPVAFTGVMFSISYMLLTRIITEFGSEPLAALGLGHRIEGLAYFASVGFAVAAETLVGQNLGAGKAHRAERSAWMTLFYTSVLLGIVSLLFFLFAEPIVRSFISDPRVVSEGSNYLRIIAIFEIFLGFEVVLEGAFSGAGNSIPPMTVSVPLTWARIPLALLLANVLGWGSAGIWWSISMTTGLKGMIIGLWFKRGTWKHQKV